MAWRAPREALVGAVDQLGPALDQHLDRHVVGDQVLLDEQAHEVEVGLGGRREPDLDLLEAHLHERLEHAALARRVHRVDQGLVAVAQVDRAPAGRLRELLVRPGAVGQLERHERAVLVERHRLRGHRWWWHVAPRRGSHPGPENKKPPGPQGSGGSASADCGARRYISRRPRSSLITPRDCQGTAPLSTSARRPPGGYSPDPPRGPRAAQTCPPAVSGDRPESPRLRGRPTRPGRSPEAIRALPAGRPSSIRIGPCSVRAW